MKRVLQVFIIPSILILSSCVDLPDDIILPSWDVELNVPILNKSYTVMEAIEDDTSEIKWYKDGPNEGLLYFSETERIEPIIVGDNLEIDGTSTTASVEIGSIKIDDPEPVDAPIAVSDWTPFQGGQTLVIPQSGQVSTSKPFDIIGQFESVILESGKANISITNVMPVQVVFNRFTIRNANDGSIVVDDDSGIAIDANQTSQKVYDLSNKRVDNNLDLEATISTPGSGGNQVTLAQNAGTTITSQLADIVIEEATAELPDQDPFSLDSSFVFDDSTFIETVVFEDGSLTFTIDNNIDLDISAQLNITNLQTPSGSAYTQNINLGRNETNKTIQISSLKNYKIVDPQSSLTNKLFYSVVVNASGTNDARTIKKTDGVSIDIGVSNMILNSLTGRIKPTSLDVEETSIDLDLGDLKDQFTMSEINLDNPQIRLKLNESADIEIGFSGQLIGKNSNQTREIPIPYTVITRGENLILLNPAEVSDFIKGFTTDLPESFSVRGTGLVNPNYNTGTVAKSDSIFGTAEIEFPFKVGISEGSFRDSTEVDITESDKDDADQVRAGNITVELENYVPGTVTYMGEIYDVNNNFLMNLPPNRPPNTSSISAGGATVGADGIVTGPSSSTIIVDLNKEEIDKILNSQYVISKVTFFTSGSNNQPVEFRTTDSVRVKIYGSVTYRVEEDKK